MSQPALEGGIGRQTRWAKRDGVVSDSEQHDINDLKLVLWTINALNLGKDIPVSPNLRPSYWLDLKEYRPSQTARELDMLLLILQGLLDEVLSVADVEGWGEALIQRENVAFRGYRTHDHVLADVREDVWLAEDVVQGHVAANVISDLVAWIAGEFPARTCEDLESWYAGCHGGLGARVGP